MKNLIPHIALIILMFGLSSTVEPGEKSTLQWKSFNSGLAEAKASNKKVLVDVYTDWCGWCKKMDKEVYANRDVANYLEKRYVVVKVNAESDASLRSFSSPSSSAHPTATPKSLISNSTT